MQDGIRPIVQLPPGVCKVCRSPLNVVLSDMVSVTLSDSGMPVASDTFKSSIKGICPKCLTEHPMMRRGLFYVPDTEWGRTMKCEDSFYEPKVVKGTDKENPFTVTLF